MIDFVPATRQSPSGPMKQPKTSLSASRKSSAPCHCARTSRFSSSKSSKTSPINFIERTNSSATEWKKCDTWKLSSRDCTAELPIRYTLERSTKLHLRFSICTESFALMATAVISIASMVVQSLFDCRSHLGYMNIVCERYLHPELTIPCRKLEIRWKVLLHIWLWSKLSRGLDWSWCHLLLACINSRTVRTNLQLFQSTTRI